MNAFWIAAMRGRFFYALRGSVRGQNAHAALLTSVLAVGACVFLAPPAIATDPPDSASTLRSPAADRVRTQVLAWMEERKVDPMIRTKAAEMWAAGLEKLSGTELLERTVKTFALADENVRNLVEQCSAPRSGPSLTDQAWLKDSKMSPLVAANLRLWYARWLVHQSLYEEALEQLDGLRPEDVVDPASLLFYESVVHHRLLNKEQGIEAVSKLLETADQGPRRYVNLARLMEADLKALKVDSLDHIARRMEDVERRLDLGRAGKKVRKVEDGVIESLDKLIKQLEDQQQQQGGGAAANNIQSSRPASDSQIMGGKGKGEVTRRNIGTQSGWGDLPPRQREEALQQIGRDFPSHYRDVVEQYFRKLATEGSEK